MTLAVDRADVLENRWDAAHAATLSPERLLLYRSNLLGADKRITNRGGGNTSSKLVMPDPLTGEPVTVLWVKGSGDDLGSMKLDGFATLYQAKLETLVGRYRGPQMEDDMVALYNHCTFNLNPRAPSIDTPLHGLVCWPHVDHVHPDAVIAIAATPDSRAITREIYGGEIGWLDWRRQTPWACPSSTSFVACGRRRRWQQARSSARAIGIATSSSWRIPSRWT